MMPNRCGHMTGLNIHEKAKDAHMLTDLLSTHRFEGQVRMLAEQDQLTSEDVNAPASGIDNIEFKIHHKVPLTLLYLGQL